MSSPNVQDVPYGGTISVDFDGNIDLNTPIKEFYRLPLKQKNEITVLVQATSDARILLSDDNTNPDIKPVPVEIVIGGKGNTSLSVGLAQDDGTGKYPKEVVQTPKLLSATHWKAFSIRWYYGRVMVYNHGYQKPIITWDGPKDGSVSFSQVGVRTLGCSGQWRVQGLPKFNTADGDAYKKMDINCGRLDFEVSAWRDAYIQFVSKPEAAGTAPRIHCVLGYGDPRSFSAVFLNGNAVSPVQETVPTLSTNEYRRFWFKWDCNNFMIGRGDSTAPFTQWLKSGQQGKPIGYFGFSSHYYNDYCFFHILEETREEDKAERKPGEQNYVGNEVEWTSMTYNSYV